MSDRGDARGTADDAPPDEPPEVCATLHGFRVWPCSLSVCQRIEYVRIGLANDNGAGIFQVLEVRIVGRCDNMLQRLYAICVWGGRVRVHLHGHRHAVQRAQGGAACL